MSDAETPRERDARLDACRDFLSGLDDLRALPSSFATAFFAGWRARATRGFVEREPDARVVADLKCPDHEFYVLLKSDGTISPVHLPDEECDGCAQVVGTALNWRPAAAGPVEDEGEAVAAPADGCRRDHHH